MKSALGEPPGHRVCMGIGRGSNQVPGENEKHPVNGTVHCP